MSNVTIRNNIPILNKALLKASGLGLNTMAAVLEKTIVENIRSNMPPPNAPATIEKKGSSSTLIDTGELMNSVDSQVQSDKSMWVGFFGQENALKMFVNEFGLGDIPSRPAMRNAINDQSDKDAMNEAVKKELRKAIESAKIR